ncbi:hypothetical protein GQ54DRAFT_161663 [Martensiomyces pterosporus]|nr:hypothetical protein GQ54DRAFT_161663 [Martensiomyces pterosporus]
MPRHARFLPFECLGVRHYTPSTCMFAYAPCSVYLLSGRLFVSSALFALLAKEKMWPFFSVSAQQWPSRQLSGTIFVCTNGDCQHTAIIPLSKRQGCRGACACKFPNKSLKLGSHACGSSRDELSGVWRPGAEIVEDSHVGGLPPNRSSCQIWLPLNSMRVLVGLDGAGMAIIAALALDTCQCVPNQQLRRDAAFYSRRPHAPGRHTHTGVHTIVCMRAFAILRILQL